MIKIHDEIKKVVEEDIEIKNTLSRGLLNLSGYAKTIQKKVSKRTKKEVGVQSIVVSLSRIQRKLKAYNYMPNVKIKQLSVKQPVIELVYLNNKENLNKIAKVSSTVMDSEDNFISISTSTKDIAMVVSEEYEGKVRNIYQEKPKVYKNKLSAISIRFDDKFVEQPGIGFSLMQKIASRNIVLEEVVSTYNEFTLVVESKEVPRILGVLS